jgi:hypothetical protein
MRCDRHPIRSQFPDDLFEDAFIEHDSHRLLFKREDIFLALLFRRKTQELPVNSR